MTTSDPLAYTFIPPPPLPEFYQRERNRKGKASKSTSSSSTVEVETQGVVLKDVSFPVDGTYDDRTRAATMGRWPSAPLTTFLPPPISRGGFNDIPPLAIYHICRVCLRPRSSRYHEEHPIPVNGLPPPPGICRRCRVTSVEETNRVAEIVTEGESNEIKIGFIQPFVAEEDVISNQKMKEIKAEEYLSRMSHKRLPSHHQSRPCKDIMYRQVRVVDDPESAARERRTKVTFTRNVMNDYEDESLPAEPAPVPMTRTTSMQAQPTHNPPSMQTKTVEDGPTCTSSSSSSSTAKTPSTVAKLAQPECTGSDVRRIARNEIERYRDIYWKTERSDSNIRRIAREEVERYRQAERRLEAHPNPYVRGRMVPVERRSEQERDVAEPMPWTKVTGPERTSGFSPGPQKTSSIVVQGSTAEVAPTANLVEQKYSERSQGIADIDREQGQAQRHEQIRERHQHHGERRAKSREPAHGRREQHRELGIKVDGFKSTKSSDNPTCVNSRGPFDKGVDSDPPLEPFRAKTDNRDTVYNPVHEANLSLHSTPPNSRPPPSSTGRLTTKETPIGQPHKEREIHFARYQSRNHGPTSTVSSGSQESWTSSNFSKRTERDNGYDESIVRTIDTRSSRPHATSGTAGHDTGIGSDQKLQETSYHEASNIERFTETSQTRRKKDLPYPEDDSPIDRIVKPVNEGTERPFRDASQQNDLSELDYGTEYLYAERIVQPAHRPLGSRPFDDHRPARRVEVDEVIQWKRNPVDPREPIKRDCTPRRDHSPPAKTSKANESRADRVEPGEHKSYFAYERSRSPSLGSERMDRKKTAVESSKVDDNIPLRRNTKVEVHDKQNKAPHAVSPSPQRQRHDNGKQDLRVQFSSKLDISPTPPDSDASSSKIRRFHRVTRKGGRQFDGNESSEPYANTAEEYERRSRVRGRDRGACYDHREKQKSAPEQRRDREAAIKPEARSEERNYASKRRGRLARALSESPAREETLPLPNFSKFRSKLNKIKLDLEALRRHTSESNLRNYELSSSERNKLRSNRKRIRELEFELDKIEKAGSDAEEENISKFEVALREAGVDTKYLVSTLEKLGAEAFDGSGPYRVLEKITDSMMVEDGSPVGRPGYRRSRDV